MIETDLLLYLVLGKNIMPLEVNASFGTFLDLCHMRGMVKVFVVWYQTYVKSY
jgi:hypothetical protein